MNNIFPIYEDVCIEEVYGIKRPNAQPPTTSKTFTFVSNNTQSPYPCSDSYRYDWFSKESISVFERNSFSFLKDQNEIQEYLRIRNCILDLYTNKTFITLSMAYNEVKGSFSLVSKIHSFLERQKIINNRNILEECKKLIEDCCKNKVIVSNQPVKNNIIKKQKLTQLDLNKECNCTKQGEYKSVKGDFLCKDCLDQGLYEPSYTHSDFSYINEEIIKKIWTKKEEILLLEAIDRFGDDWSSVANHVKSRNIYECILYFINMPIQEKEIVEQNFSIRLPFVKTPNPVMYLITFICSVVHPTLGSFAAHEALKEIKNNQIVVYKKILEKTKSKAKDLIALEEDKIKRMELVIEEALVNIINFKAKTLIDLDLSENKVREELVVLRTKMINNEFE